MASCFYRILDPRKLQKKLILFQNAPPVTEWFGNVDSCNAVEQMLTGTPNCFTYLVRLASATLNVMIWHKQEDASDGLVCVFS